MRVIWLLLLNENIPQALAGFININGKIMVSLLMYIFEVYLWIVANVFGVNVFEYKSSELIRTEHVDLN